MKSKRLYNITVFAIVVLLIACTTVLFSACTAAPSKQQSLCITEVVSSNKHSLIDEAVGTPDWIELYNPTDAAIDLSGYGLSDNMRSFHKYVFPENTVIEAGQYLIVYAGDNNGAVSTAVPCTGFGLSKSGDYLFLTDPYYELLVEMQVPALSTDVSYARRSDGSFGYSAVTTPGAENIESSILDSLSSVFAEQDFAALMISEVMPSEVNDGPWVELYNSSDHAINLSNYYLSDSDLNYQRFQLPDSVVEPKGYAVVYMSGEQTGAHALETSFKLSSADTAVYLTSIDGTLVGELSWEIGIPAGISVVSEQGGLYCAFPTCGAVNAENTFASFDFSEMDDTDRIRINEVLQQNKYSLIDADGDRGEWVELFNASNEAVSLRGYYLSDTAENLFRYALPDVTIGAGEYLVVFLSGKDRTDAEIHANFGLSLDETMLYLTDANKLRTDALPLLHEEKANVSVGRAVNGSVQYFAQPTPGSENAKGFETADTIGFFNTKSLFISEVCAVNAPSSGRNDWIELYNGSAESIDLTGWYLSDSLNEPDRWKFLEGPVVESGAYLTVETTSHSVRHKSGVGTFGLSAAGEAIVLSDQNLNPVDVFVTGSVSAGITCGRMEDDPFTERVYFTSASKGKQNSTSTRVGYASQPVFSENKLYHTEPVSVSITAASPNVQIYYTTNGDIPTNKSKQYVEPIRISNNTVLRAVAYAEGMLPSEITSATYLFGATHTLPVVTIAIDREDFSEVSDATKTDKPERPAQISYFEADGTLGVSFPAGLKAKGQGTITYAQKSFSISLRGGYGRSSVTYPFFEDCETTTYSSLVIRNSGQDIEEARMRDSLFSRIVSGMNLDYAHTHPVVVYINGEYWGLYDFNEELNSEYLETHYGVDSDAVDFVKRNKTVLKGSNQGYLQARDWGQNKKLSDDTLFAEFAEMVDVAYCTDYIIAQTFIINSDMFNQKFWHSQDNTVKWRPVFFDLDWGLNEASSVKRNLLPAYFSVDGIPSRDGSVTNLDVFVGLKRNANWREQFIERYVEMMCTQFSPERTLMIFDELYSAIEPEMERHIKRWGFHSDMDDWREHAEILRDRLNNRPAAALDNLQEYFEISDGKMEELIAKYSA